MRSQFPFTDYDFWAYLSSGFAFLLTLDYIVGTNLLVGRAWSFFDGLVAAACAYAIGHMIAGLASALFERRLVRRGLGNPSTMLLGVQQGPAWFQRIYPSYYEVLPEETRDAILAKAGKSGIHQAGESLYWAAFSSTRENRTAMERVSTFLNLYSMCRNLSLTALISSLMLVVSAWWFARPFDAWLALAVFVLSVGMFLRYLKFLRHYSLEILTTYAHTK